MKRKHLYLLASLYLGLLLGVPGIAQEDMQFVDNSVFENPKRPAARFEHDAHNETAGIEECNVCHHVYTDGKLVEDESSEDQSCAECHTLEPSDKQPSLRRAFHLNCKGCHQQEGAGPIMCAECHQNERALKAAAESAH